MAGNILFVARSTGQWSDSQHCMNIVVISSAPENTGTEVEKIIIRDHFLMKQNKYYIIINMRFGSNTCLLTQHRHQYERDFPLYSNCIHYTYSEHRIE